MNATTVSSNALRKPSVVSTFATSFAVGLALVGSIPAPAGIINVPADQATIVDALDASFPGDEIIIQAGTYDEIDFLYIYDTLTLTGTNGPVIVHVPDGRDAAIQIASGVTNVVVTGLTFERPTTSQTWMRSAQLSGNSQATFNNCVFDGGGATGHGVGAILFHGADGTFNSCTFSNFNPAPSWAAAIQIEGLGATQSDVIASNCVFDTGCNRWFRTADFDTWTYAQSQVWVGEVTFVGCTFKPNNYAHGLKLRNGPYQSVTYDPTKEIVFEDCRFEGSSLELAEFHYTTNAGPAGVKFSRCTFEAYDSGRRMMYLAIPTPITFENCLFAGGQHQTVVRVWGGPPSVDFFHCTMITDGIGGTNSTFIDGWDNGRTFNIVNSLFRCTNNFSAGFVGDPGSSSNRTYAIVNSVIDHPTPAGANAIIAPGAGYSNTSLTGAFVDEASRDYHLLAGSPWVDGGMDLGFLLDLDGNARNQGAAPDMGAYESAFAVAPTINIAGSVGGAVVTFTGVLEAATDVAGPFTEVLGATSPWPVSATNGMQVFRARSP